MKLSSVMIFVASGAMFYLKIVQLCGVLYGSGRFDKIGP